MIGGIKSKTAQEKTLIFAQEFVGLGLSERNKLEYFAALRTARVDKLLNPPRRGGKSKSSRTRIVRA
ncbi:MAG: hypothetical protein HY736_05420 [Verrucomicrobia bacterium]|nr:hypothetical protein [Verrucomicrobiota bacterium]